MSAHLAIARALHPAAPTKDGRAAEQLLASLGANQPHADVPVTVDRAQFWVIE
jgi:hypothetical protein